MCCAIKGRFKNHFQQTWVPPGWGQAQGLLFKRKKLLVTVFLSGSLNILILYKNLPEKLLLKKELEISQVFNIFSRIWVITRPVFSLNLIKYNEEFKSIQRLESLSQETHTLSDNFKILFSLDFFNSQCLRKRFLFHSLA